MAPQSAASGPDTLDPRAARLLHMLAAGDVAHAQAPSVHERRESLRALAALTADPPPPDVTCEATTCPAADGAELKLRRYRPPGADERRSPALLYLHGGGWVAGDLDTHAGVCGALALASGCNIFALDYRRPPEHPFPGPLEDALAALAWLRVQADALGLDGGRIGLGGDSAGANLAAAAALDRRAGPLALQLLICPILDLPRATGSRERFGRGFFLSAERLAADAADYLQDASPHDPRVSPALAPDLAEAPPTLIHAAACDPFRDEALHYAQRLRAAGVPVNATVHPGMIHYFYAMARAIPYARTALTEVGAQVRERMFNFRRG